MQSPFVVWHQDLALRNILLDWSRWATDKVVQGTLIDWDEAISGPEEYTYTSPAQIMLGCPRFRKTLSEESVRDLHRHSEKLLSDAWLNSRCARIARNQVLSSVINVIDGEFAEERLIKLCVTVCKDWEQGGSRWRALVAQKAYCLLEHPPPAGDLENIEDSEDDEDDEADFSDVTGAVESAIAKCEGMQRTPEAVDLARKDGYVQEGDRYKVCDVATTPLSEDPLVSTKLRKTISGLHQTHPPLPTVSRVSERISITLRSLY